eukprot:2452336-Pleurochrysis_carterae.AAC.1
MKRKCQEAPFPVFRPESVDISLYPDKHQVPVAMPTLRIKTAPPSGTCWGGSLLQPTHARSYTSLSASGLHRRLLCQVPRTGNILLPRHTRR